MESEPIYLSIPSHPKNLRDVRRLMIDITSQAGISTEDSGNLILAVDEVCSNIIKHSYKNDFHQKIDLTVELETNFLTISVLDDGIRFDINSVGTRDLNEVKPGGLGLYIIEKVMDTVEYSHTPEGKNKIKMVKKLTG